MLQEGKTNGAFAVLVHNAKGCGHHWFTRAFGSKIPYGHPVLTNLSRRMHVKVHRAMKKFLQGKKKRVNGETVSMYPTRGNSGEKIRRNFTPRERIKAAREFVEDFEGGKYLDNIDDELQIIKKEGHLK